MSECESRDIASILLTGSSPAVVTVIPALGDGVVVVNAVGDEYLDVLPSHILPTARVREHQDVGKWTTFMGRSAHIIPSFLH